MMNNSDLDRNLVMFNEYDGITLRQLFEGVIAFGTSGSAKTSTTAHMFAHAFMDSGFGGLVLTAKVEEKDQWLEWAIECDREQDLVIFKPANPVFYNCIERVAKNQAKGDTEAVVGLIEVIVEIANGGSIQTQESYWKISMKMMMSNAIDMLKCAGEVVSFENMYRFIVTAPTSVSRLGSGDFQKESYCFICLSTATDNYEKVENSNDKETHFEDFDIAFTYWTYEFPNLAEKTRSIIVSMFTGSVNSFLRGHLKKLFNSDLQRQEVAPELARQGKIIILDLPIKEHEKTGIIGQGVYKLCFQKAMEREKVTPQTPNVFLFADEAHFTLTSYEDSFQTTARSSRIATFYLTQGLSNLELNLGDNAEKRAKSLLTNLGTKIFHAQVDEETNLWASKLIGEDWALQSSSSSSFNQEDIGQISTSLSDSRRFIVEPIVFSKLLRGGTPNDYIASAIVHQVGRTWSTEENFLEVFMKQEF